MDSFGARVIWHLTQQFGHLRWTEKMWYSRSHQPLATERLRRPVGCGAVLGWWNVLPVQTPGCERLLRAIREKNTIGARD